jgi:hypothetical protein
MVQETLKRDPHNGHLFCFRGRQGGLIKVIWHDGQGACQYEIPDTDLPQKQCSRWNRLVDRPMYAGKMPDRQKPSTEDERVVV